MHGYFYYSTGTSTAIVTHLRLLTHCATPARHRRACALALGSHPYRICTPCGCSTTSQDLAEACELSLPHPSSPVEGT